MSQKDLRLSELEFVGTTEAREALSCVLHTILFCRAPGPFRPQTVHSEHFNLAYCRVGCSSVTRGVDTAVDSLLTGDSLVSAGPDLLRGDVVLSFFERRRSRSLFGLVSSEEKVTWEQWITPFLVSVRTEDDVEVRRNKLAADVQLRCTIADIYAMVNDSLDHVPSCMYEFDITTRNPTASHLSEPRDGGYTRVILNPPLYNLSSL
mmetsp:Transcript_27949/g.90122  ORF Transcript_27949/g.90122 Transcript_27949/m.90122 type:complete len:206 (-) Transcript_27949:154-771(-)|eukprot:CAMPEP_0118908786 /NCGR_PEP_ID=MMETSP1166-20130328/11641_1 /TAXON_ID=1104430 /ORGANISM="Chrysoreinhardia sp, Strain CCMP3193" /LENGTH=205 /DNA_ID=CAMNT_0006848185 /DNA_START=242 /DNA_END=859 /DNA_ORIENTATION=+